MSEVTIAIPSPLRPFTKGQKTVIVSGNNVGEVLNNLVTTFNDLKKHLYTDDGQLRNFVNIYKGEDDIRYLNNEETLICHGAEFVREGDGYKCTIAVLKYFLEIEKVKV